MSSSIMRNRAHRTAEVDAGSVWPRYSLVGTMGIPTVGDGTLVPWIWGEPARNVDSVDAAGIEQGSVRS